MYYTLIQCTANEFWSASNNRDTGWVIISEGSEILQLYNLFCNTQHRHMPVLSEQLLVITSTFEPM